MGEGKNITFYVFLVILITIIFVNIIVLIIYFELPSSILGEIKKQQPLYQGQTVPVVSNFSKIMEDPKFQQMKAYPPLKGEPKGNPKPFAPIIIKETR